MSDDVTLTQVELEKANAYMYSRKTIMHDDGEFYFYHGLKGALHHALRVAINDYHEEHRMDYERFMSMPTAKEGRRKTILYAELDSEGLMPICADWQTTHQELEDVVRRCLETKPFTDDDLADALVWGLRARMVLAVQRVIAEWRPKLEALTYTVWLANQIDLACQHIPTDSERTLDIEIVVEWMLSQDKAKVMDHCLRGVQPYYDTDVCDLWFAYYN